MGALRHAINSEYVDNDFLIMACTDEEVTMDDGDSKSILDRMAAMVKKEEPHG